MQTRLMLTLAIFLSASLPITAQKNTPISNVELAEITTRGRMLAEYDQAAWHSSDAVQALKPAKGSVGRYLASKTDAGWVVAFGHLNEARDKLLITYEATQGRNLQEFTAKKCDPPKEDIGFYFVAAKAIDTALHDFQGEKRAYNVAVLPVQSGQIHVYVYPAQTQQGVYPLGGDARYLISQDGSSIVKKRQLHKSIIENRDQGPLGTKTVSGGHTHILSDVPEDTDVFYVLSRKPSMPEYVGAGKVVYVVEVDGTIRRVR